MIHAYSSGHWFAQDGTLRHFEPEGSILSGTHIFLYIVMMLIAFLIILLGTDLHDNADLGARGNDDILYTANTNCSNLSLDALL